MSFVEVQPSESIRLKVCSTTFSKINFAENESTTASVIITESIVANEGANMPAPLAIPAKATPDISDVAIFGLESVVMIPVAQSKRLALERFATATFAPLSNFSNGSRTPINPVEQTTTSLAEAPSKSATCSAVLCVSTNPSGPVQAFAPPLFRITALTS
ncbi:unannotated protein [freshwater metagenome]|uniref:Unannotated protein n=1 Tax=freshwater metagenome TaxID=449393 RepID=A0A6J6X723_9ZZZZ